MESLEERRLLSFGPALPLGVGSAALAAGDFNGDGKLDLVGANSAGSTVSVLLGKGTGTFQAPVTYAAGTNPVSVAVGDFNKDGKLDLAVANLGGVSVLLGKGDGTFLPPTNYAAGVAPDYVAVGDFNGDGKLDLAVANRRSGNVSLLLGRSNGTFQTSVNFTVGGVPVGLAVGDFDGDGKLDLAVADYNSGGAGRVAVLLGNGNGTFQGPASYPTSTAAQAVAAGDFNGDGALDLAVANSDGNLTVLLGRGDGTFQPGVNYAGGQDSVAVADVNNDGNADLVSVNEASKSVSVLLGNGDGTFQPRAGYRAGGTSVAVVVADFTNDHLPDLAIVNRGTGPGDSVLVNIPLATRLNISAPGSTTPGTAFSITVVAQDSFGNIATGYTGTVSLSASDSAAALPTTYTFTSADHGVHTFTNGVILWATGPQTIAVADTTTTAGQVAAGLTATATVTVDLPVQPPPAPVEFDPPLEAVVGLQPVSLALGDFNNDGKPDLVTANLGSTHHLGSLSVLLGKGDGTFQDASTFPVGLTSTIIAVAVGDFNGDHKQDLAVASLVDNTVTILLGNGDGTFRFGRVLGLGFLPTSLAVADLNGDGKADLVVTNWGNPQAQTGGGVTVFLGDGDGSFHPPLNTNAGTESASVVVGDFNGDHKLDLAVANRVSNNVSILLGNGNGTFQPAVNYAAGQETVSITAADLNGDGKLDLVTADATSATLSVLLGNGNGTFQTAVDYPVGEDPEAVTVADVNGDGKKDLIVTANYDQPTGTVSVLLGNGNGTFNQPTDYPVGPGPVPVVAADFNGDGVADLAVGVAGHQQAPAATVFVLLNQGATQLQFSTPTYRVGENDGVATITVTRTGDINGAVTVHYRTANGTAVAGADYTAASGTLTFPPGETALTFTVPIRGDSLVEGNETINLILSGPTGGATLAGGPVRAVLTIRDADGSLNQRFVAQVYLDLLGRPVDAASLAGWTNLLDRGAIARSQVAQGIESSTEYRVRLVQGVYQTYLGRPADPAGLNGFVTLLASGGTPEQMLALILSSPEYFNRVGGSNLGYITALYRDLFGRVIEPAAAAGWSNHLDGGGSRADVATALITSREGRQILVQGFYQRFLGRSADSSGLKGFTNALMKGMPDEQVIALLISSDEFVAGL